MSRNESVVLSTRATKEKGQAVDSLVRLLDKNRSTVIEECIPYHPAFGLLSQAWPESARKMLREWVDPPMETITLERAGVGDVVDAAGTLYVVTGKVLPDPAGGTRPVCNLREVSNGTDRKASLDLQVARVHRLDPRLPADFLQLSLLEERAVGCLAEGPQDLQAVFRKVNVRRGFDVSERRISRVELAGLAGRLMAGLVVNGLVIVRGDPVAGGVWSLTSRGRQVAAKLQVQEV